MFFFFVVVVVFYVKMQKVFCEGYVYGYGQEYPLYGQWDISQNIFLYIQKTEGHIGLNCHEIQMRLGVC